MKTGKKIILKYCNNIKTGDVDHLQASIDIKNALRKNIIDKTYLISHCPSAFGLDDFIGECEKEYVSTYSKQIKQCKLCWDRALEYKK